MGVGKAYENKGVILLKFGKKEHILNLMKKGEIFMQTRKYHRENTDEYEGTWKVLNNQNFELDGIVLPSRNQLRFHVPGYGGHIWCAFGANNRLLDNSNQIYRISSKLDESWTHGLIIKNSDLFLDMVFDELKKNNFSAKADLVDYKNLSTDEHAMNPFIKHESFNHESEYRIWVKTQTSEPLKLYIGSIEDYTQMLTTQELIERIKIKNIPKK